LTRAYEAVARIHNESELPSVDDPTVRHFHSHQFLVLGSERFVDACLGAVSDPWLRALPRIGSIDQFVDSTDVLSFAPNAARLRSMYAT
jgi:hypothetical protein